MSVTMRWIALSLTALGILLPASPRAPQQGVAYLALDLSTRATIAVERPERIDTPILPGSVMKVAALAAALESRVIDADTVIACPRRVDVDGHSLTCTHPDLQRPL